MILSYADLLVKRKMRMSDDDTLNNQLGWLVAIGVLRPGFETSGCACLGGQG